MLGRIAAVEAAEMSRHGQAQCQDAESERHGVKRAPQFEIADAANSRAILTIRLMRSVSRYVVLYI